MVLGIKDENKRVIVRDNDVLRPVDNLEEAQEIIFALEKADLMNNLVVNTKVYSVDKKLLSHEKISQVIYSGEFTVSMAYDLTELAIKTCLKMVDFGVYTWDFFPHNLTYVDGCWVLYDFGAFSLNTRQVKTQIRSMFKICFSSFELLKIIDRSKLKRCFLNRISDEELRKMLPIGRFLLYELRKTFCLFLNVLGFRKLSYCGLRKVFESYKKGYYRKVYVLQDINSEIFDKIDNLLDPDIKNVFATGKVSADWALRVNNEIKTFIYADDYDFTDEVYNLIVSDKRYKNISTAVLYPLINDKEISSKISYRALYDCFAQERFKSDCAIFLNFEEFLGNNEMSLSEICTNLARFFTKMMIIKIGRDDNLLENLKNILIDNVNNFEIISIAEGYLITCFGNNFRLKKFEPSAQDRYQNGNRHVESHIQSKEIIDIICDNK